jgi:branched-subunit amino acid transport protein AzlD
MQTPDNGYVLAAVAVSTAITWGLRALPFAALAPLRASRTVSYLSSRMPAGVMVILVVYCLRGTPLNHPAQALAPICALGTTVALHLWRRNALLSIIGGTLVSVVLATALPFH